MGNTEQSAPVLTEQRVVESQIKEMAASRAAAEPFPGPLSDAFVVEDIQVPVTRMEGGKRVKTSLTVRPYVSSDWIIMRKLNSPLYQHSLEAAKPKEQREDTQFEDEDAMEIAFQFTRPAKVVRQVLKSGREAFREAAVAEFGDFYEPAELNKVVEAVVKQLGISWSTTLAHGGSTEEGTTGDPFSSAATSPKTTSDGAAGGSTTGAAS